MGAGQVIPRYMLLHGTAAGHTENVLMEPVHIKRGCMKYKGEGANPERCKIKYRAGRGGGGGEVSRLAELHQYRTWQFYPCIPIIDLQYLVSFADLMLSKCKNLPRIHQRHIFSPWCQLYDCSGGHREGTASQMEQALSGVITITTHHYPFTARSLAMFHRASSGAHDNDFRDTSFMPCL